MESSRSFGLGLLAGVIAVASACSSDDSLSASEAQFEEAFLQPLVAAGLDYSVEEVCHYERQNSGAPWHLQVRVSVEADPNEVADALVATVDIIERDRDPMILQQYAGEPNRGWDGVLESETGDTALGLTKHHVDVGGDLPSVGWLPVCMFSQ